MDYGKAFDHILDRYEKDSTLILRLTKGLQEVKPAKDNYLSMRFTLDKIMAICRMIPSYFESDNTMVMRTISGMFPEMVQRKVIKEWSKRQERSRENNSLSIRAFDQQWNNKFLFQKIDKHM